MILVIEHRAAMSPIINREHPEAAPAAPLREVKPDVVKRTALSATAIPLNPVDSFAQSTAQSVLPPKTAFISAIKEQKYLVDFYSRKTTWLERWGIEKAKKIGTPLVLAARVN